MDARGRLITLVVGAANAFLREGLCADLEHQPDMQVLASVSDAEHVLLRCREDRPDVVVAVLDLPGVQMHEFVYLVSAHSDSGLLLLVYDPEDAIIPQDGITLRVGYALSQDTPEVLREGIRHLANGATLWMSPKVLSVAVTGETSEKAKSLSDRETDVLRLLASGNSTMEISEELCVAHGTVKNILVSVNKRLGVAGRAKAVAWAWRNGVVSVRSSDNNGVKGIIDSLEGHEHNTTAGLGRQRP